MMIINIRCMKIALLLCFVHDVAPYPKPGVNHQDPNKDTPNGVQKHVNLPKAGDSQQITKNKNSLKYQREVVHGIKNYNTEKNTRGDSENQQEEDDIIGKNIMNENSIQGEINLSNQLDGSDIGNKNIQTGIHTGNIKGSKYNTNLKDSAESQGVDDDTITGKIEMDDDGNVEGTIYLPDEGGSDQPDSENANSSEGDDDDGDSIAGSIEIQDDGGIEGTMLLPDDGGNDHPDLGNSNNDQGGNDEAIAGSIEIKDDSGIEETIDVPDLDDSGQPGTGNAVQPDTGNENGGQSAGEDTFTGSEEMNSDGIIGTINLPGVDENDGNAQNNGSVQQDAGNDEIIGDMTIDDDGNISGNLAIGTDGDNSIAENSKDSFDEGTPSKTSTKDSQGRPKDSQSLSIHKKNCWMNLNSKQYLDALDEIDAKYSKARRQYQDEIGPGFDEQMMQVLLSSQGKAPRAIHQAYGNPNIIPAGLNIGGFGMMRMPGSILFFHRMKLRNSTVFRVDFLETNIMDMSLVARLSLNDLHLRGSYERATTEDDMASMYFVPTFGELDVLIKTVNYKMEGRLRMLNNRLLIEVVNSNILTREILLSYANSSALARNIEFNSIEDFVSRMKCDLDLWLKDYFNDYLMYFGIVGGGKNSEIQLYEKEKTIKANEYADHALRGIKKKLRDIKASNVKLPSFTLLSVTNHKIELRNGILRGLDSLYRRSVAMTKKEEPIRILDIMIGFSNLKVEYQYVASVVRGPPLAGLLIFTADELAAHLEISQVVDSQTIDMNVDSIIQLKSESLTVEGPANRLIAQFKYLLENPIIAIMTNVMKHNVKMLKTLTRCEPNLWGEDREQNSYTNENDETFPNKTEKKVDNIMQIGEEYYFGEDEEVNAFSDEEKARGKIADKWEDQNTNGNGIIPSQRMTVSK